jgi:serine/threonine protein kinase
MKISIFKIENIKSQPFLTIKYDKHINQKSLKNILVDHTPSLVGTLEESGFIIKFIRARSWHEYLKLLWNRSRITKEIKGNKLLAGLRLNVPKIHETGLGIIPSIKHEYLGYYIMDNLSQSGYQELSKLIKDGALNEPMREKIMYSVYKGLKVMRENNIVFSDFHLDNIFANKMGDITWIDTGVTTYSLVNNKKFRLKYNQSITRYINYEYEGEILLSQSEKAIFEELLITLKKS